MGNEKETAVAEVKKSPRALLVEQVGQKLEGMIAEHINAFPKTFNKTRFVQNCMVVLADTKDIEKCKPASVIRTLIKGAYLNLDFFRKECYAIPYNNKETGELELNFQTDYKGERKLCMEYGRGIKEVYAKIVREGDVLEVGIESGHQRINFTPKPFNDAPIQGAFAVVITDKDEVRFDTMSVKEIEDIRAKSKAPNSPAWKDHWGEMAKKTVMRRLTKLEDLNFKSREQEEAYADAGDLDFKNKGAKAPAPAVADPFKDKGQVKTEDAVLVDKGAEAGVTQGVAA